MRKIQFTIILLLGLIAFQSSAQNVKFDQNLFDQWIDMRVGEGDATYWYCFGEVYSYPEGELLMRMQGVDLAKAIRVEKDSVIQLNRKIFIYTDKNTGEVLETYNDKPVQHIKYPYQQITYALQGDRLASYVTQGSGKRRMTMGPGYNTTARKMGNSYVFTAPVFLNMETPRGKYEAYENYDFYVFPEESKLEHRYQLSWVRYGDLPPFAGGKGIIQLVCYRVDNFEDLPNPLRDYIKKEAKLWLKPPQNLEEIAELQQEK